MIRDIAILPLTTRVYLSIFIHIIIDNSTVIVLVTYVFLQNHN